MIKPYETDTICAVATSPGGGGSIGIIRISGDRSMEIGGMLFRPMPKNGFESHRVYYGHIMDQDRDELLDEVLVIPMYAPRSYTTEDVLEIQCHGGIQSTQRILAAVMTAGARLAEPGEFTKRAFLYGRIDLAQAEAVMDIIQAKTDLAHRAALGQAKGWLSTRIKTARTEILRMLAHIEANIDYPEHDDGEISMKEIAQNTGKLLQELQTLLQTANRGRIIRDGIQTAIVGRPNVGKSSLLNALLRQERAIVTDIPGTTRDALHEMADINGIPLCLVDTAGIRHTEDVIEQIGVSLSRQHAENADLILMVLDGASALSDEDRELLRAYGHKQVIVLVNKSDLPTQLDRSAVAKYVSPDNIIDISAKVHMGLDAFGDRLRQLFLSGGLESQNDGVVSNMRHKDALTRACISLQNTLETASLGLSQEFAAMDLTDAYAILGEITGDSLDEDIIDRIFADFCLGK